MKFKTPSLNHSSFTSTHARSIIADPWQSVCNRATLHSLYGSRPYTAEHQEMNMAEGTYGNRQVALRDRNIELGGTQFRPEMNRVSREGIRPEAITDVSQPARALPSVFCQICLESATPAATHTISGCGHSFCQDCLRMYANNAMVARRYPIRCASIADARG